MKKTIKKISAREKALDIAGIASDKKGENIVLMNMDKYSSVCEWFVLISAGNQRMIKALSKNIDKETSALGFSPIRIEGKQDPKWSLMDFGDVVVHIFYDEIREFYGLERLWKDVPQELFKEKCEKKTVKKK